MMSNNNTLDIESLSTEDRQRLLAAVIAEYQHDRLYNQIKYFEPNEMQTKLYAATKRYSEILWTCCNRGGKTKGVGAGIAFWTTGLYPHDWPGLKFKKPVRVLVMGVTRAGLREAAQRILFDELGYGFGTGTIPLQYIREKKYSRDDNDCLDYVKIEHVPTGNNSIIKFVTQQQDWKSLMGSEYDIGWPDEQVEDTRYYSQLVRATASCVPRLIILSATPETGRTKIFDRFEKEERPYCLRLKGTLWEASQYTPEQQQAMYDSYPENERPYRVYGEAVSGHGLVYNIDEKKVFIEPFKIPDNWRIIAGIDFGRVVSWTTITWLAYDPNVKDRTYFVFDHARIRNVNPDGVVPLIKLRDREYGFDIPVSWPTDGNNTEASTGNRIAHEYEKLGVNMMDEPCFLVGQDGKKTRSILAGCLEIQSLMNLDRFFIMDKPQCQILREELRVYHKDENGQIPRSESNDPHSLDSMRYAYMSADEFAEVRKDRHDFEMIESYDSSFDLYARIK